MTMGVSPESMTCEQRAVLFDAADYLSDMICDDMVVVRNHGDFQDTFLSLYLPPQFKHRYTLSFLKRVLDTVISVRWKIEDERHWMAANRMEEMMLWTMIRIAEGIAEESDVDFDADEWIDLLLEDTDFQLLFDSRLDGIEYETDTTLSSMGIGSLRPDDWWEPYEDSRLYWD